ncbi:MAG: hypothetical protein Q8N35_18095 [Methylococcaceae bacterium]|nr:hypothetical protein [Methylococcaceae bacterium]MDZ4155102.1 hypothetical protein [Methylococcales bacterium]MDP2394453.1 hypothetical protein [Methylococcaceae bacterium]MDP3021496.1 hypothetical protein [Methylococcaceae bacterium]MDP3390385.1 hypothetical protein [Methylococcaceae bacterium]
MAANITNKNFAAHWDFKIDDADIEIKENKYINDECNYYKAAKTKIKKYFSDDNRNKYFREK